MNSTPDSHTNLKPIKKVSPTLARLLTAGVWTAGVATLYMSAKNDSEHGAYAGLAAMHLAPAVGYGYAGEFGKGIIMSGLTALGSGMTLAGLAGALGAAYGGGGGGPAGLLFLGGIVLHTGTIINSIRDSGHAARRTNNKKLQMMLTPTIGKKQTGLMLSGTF